MDVLLTGAAGFIGCAVAERLLARGDRVVGLDAFDPLTGLALKRARALRLAAQPRFTLVEGDLGDDAVLARAFGEARPDVVVNLAARVGVRHSISHPGDYVGPNLVGFCRVIEAARAAGVGHFVYASSSSVYGASGALPFSERGVTDQPISFYAATKKANELLAHSYSHAYRLPTTGLRFFTVYGPWGRPDMAMFAFARALVDGRPIPLFGVGLERDFTYIDDIADAVVAAIDRPPGDDGPWDARAPRPGTSPAPFRVLNVGSHRPVPVKRVIELLGAALGKTAEIEVVAPREGDLTATCADVEALEAALGARPATPLEEGVARFVAWWRAEYLDKLED